MLQMRDKFFVAVLLCSTYSMKRRGDNLCLFHRRDVHNTMFITLANSAVFVYTPPHKRTNNRLDRNKEESSMIQYLSPKQLQKLINELTADIRGEDVFSYRMIQYWDREGAYRCTKRHNERYRRYGPEDCFALWVLWTLRCWMWSLQMIREEKLPKDLQVVLARCTVPLQAITLIVEREKTLSNKGKALRLAPVRIKCFRTDGFLSDEDVMNAEENLERARRQEEPLPTSYFRFDGHRLIEAMKETLEPKLKKPQSKAA